MTNLRSVEAVRPVHMFGYGIAPGSRSVVVLGQQEELALQHYQRRTSGGQISPAAVWGGWLADGGEAWALPWFERPAGVLLLRQMRPGDHVVVAYLSMVVSGISDAAAVLQTLSDLGVRLHVLDQRLDFAGEHVGQLSRVLQACAGFSM